MLEIFILVIFVVFGIVCYNIGKVVKENEINKERLIAIHRADSIISRAGKRFDGLHAKDKL